MPLIKLAAERQKRQIPPGMQPPENAADWFRIQNSTEESDSTDVFVFDSIGGWFGLYADEFIEQLNEVTTPKINLRLNSPGGSVFEGIAIANAIRSHSAHVTVYVDSLAASIASVIMLAGDKVVMQPQSQVMIHAASGACYGDASEMTKMADVLDFQTRNIAEAYAERSGRSVSEFLDMMAAETWLSAKETVALGLADEAAPMRPTATPADSETVEARMQRTWDLSMYHYPGRDLAPAPKIPQQVRLQDGEYVLPGQQVATAMVNSIQAIAESTTLPNATITRVIDFRDELSEGFITAFKSLVKEAVREELAAFDGAVGSHSTSVKEGTWDAGANEGRLPSPVPVATVRKMYGWYDASASEDGGIPKSACKLPHHFVSEDGTPGAASINGVRNALARLPQTQGLSDAERKTVEAHLRAHLNAFGGDDSEDHVHDDPEAVTDEPVQADDSPPAPENATPPPPPDEDEDEEGDEPPPDEEEEPADEADDWTSVIGSFISPTSPGADDVFAHLREEW